MIALPFPMLLSQARREVRRQYEELGEYIRVQCLAINGQPSDESHPYRAFLSQALNDLRAMSSGELRALAGELISSLNDPEAHTDPAWGWVLLNQLEAVCGRLARRRS